MSDGALTQRRSLSVEHGHLVRGGASINADVRRIGGLSHRASFPPPAAPWCLVVPCTGAGSAIPHWTSTTIRPTGARLRVRCLRARGSSGATNATLALAKCLCRARHRVDSTGMPRPCRGDRRTAPDGDPVGVRRLLQQEPDPLISGRGRARAAHRAAAEPGQGGGGVTRRWAPSRYLRRADRKSTRLNSSHLVISYAVFCLKKKKNKTTTTQDRS